MSNVVLELRGISKDFPGVRALDGVDLCLRSGEIHALLGENGAGKSTLAKVVAGVLQPDAGIIAINGQETRISSRRIAQKLGISMVFQELNLVPSLTVGQNLLLAHEPSRLGLLVDAGRVHDESRRVLSLVGLEVDPRTALSELGVAEQQMVALARALSFEPRILILDESTSSLTTREADRLFSVLQGFKAQGGSVLYISHRLKEVFQIADRITVLKDGKLVSTCDTANVTSEKLINMMVGRDVKAVRRRAVGRGPEILRTSHLSAKGAFTDVSMTLHSGEIVGLAGLVGSGRTALAEVIFGARPYEQGQIHIRGRLVRRMSPDVAVRLGLAFLPEDRHEAGLCLGLSLQSNVVMAALWKLFSRGVIIPRREAEAADRFIRELAISTSSRAKTVRFLSGGNQQKVVLSKWLCSESRILIFDEPTRGIDVGAKSEIHRLMDGLTRLDVGILMISSELPEVIGMSDRVYVMHEGRMVAECVGDQINEENILTYMLRGAR